MSIIRLLLSFLLVSFSSLLSAQTLLVLGDSISAAYGLDRVEQGWVALLQQRLAPQGIEVVNASISGDTTAGGLARFDPLLERIQPAIVIIELGGNDGLRGLTPAQMQTNLVELITRASKRGAKVLLLGMKMPPNYGKRYADMFQSVYVDVAKGQGVALVPFLLDSVGGHDDLMQADGIHPNLAAQPLLLDQVMPFLQPLLGAGNPPRSTR
jgi:acyl-CoA thioesterase-1